MCFTKAPLGRTGPIRTAGTLPAMWTLPFLAAVAAAKSWFARLLPPPTALGAAEATAPCFESTNATFRDPAKAGGTKLGLAAAAASVAEVVEVWLPCAGLGLEMLGLDLGDSSIVSSCQPAVHTCGFGLGLGVGG